MRLPGDSKTGRIAPACLILSSTTALAACGALGGGSPSAMPVVGAALQNGPQADYPVVIGAPYMVGDTQYTPADVLNHDEVGYVVAGTGEGITGGHHTLPYPSYVEVTSLETGRTILVRLEQRGPMDSNHLISLSPAAMTRLEAASNTPVRVRRVNPPEEQRALLRSDEAAPLRMDTPMGLVEVLKRRLPAKGSASLRAENDVPQELEPVAPVTETDLAEVAEVEELPPIAIVEPAVAPAEDPPIVQAVPEAPLGNRQFRRGIRRNRKQRSSPRANLWFASGIRTCGHGHDRTRSFRAGHDQWLRGSGSCAVEQETRAGCRQRDRPTGRAIGQLLSRPHRSLRNPCTSRSRARHCAGSRLYGSSNLQGRLSPTVRHPASRKRERHWHDIRPFRR